MKKTQSLTLADRILSVKEVFVDVKGVREARQALALPWAHLREQGKNHISLPHSSLAEILAPEAMNYFHKPFLVGVDVAEVMSAMISDDETQQICWDNAELPTNKGWVEFMRKGLGGMQMGILWQSNTHKTVQLRMYGFDQKITGAGPVYMGRVEIDFRNSKDLRYFQDHPFQQRLKLDPEAQVIGAAQFSRFFICFCAFVMTPRACETRWIGQSSQLRRQPRRPSIMPLMSFNEVSFAPLRTSSTGEHRHGDGGGVRLHDVIAHWRRIVREGRICLALVRAHSRGNPRKGIVLKKRNIAA